MTRDTTTGSSYEDVIKTCVVRASKRNNFSAIPQSIIGKKPGGGNHRVDYELIDNVDDSIRGLISCKFQSTSGTAEEKIAYEVIKLLHAMSIDSRYKHSWIVLGGEGWSPQMKIFATQHLENWIPLMKEKISIIPSTDRFLSLDLKLV
jgi:hypothetical protein